MQTETGVWTVTYNAENRPIRWVQGETVIEMAFDRLGRRVWMRESEGDAVTKEERFVYDGYLCVQRLDATQGNAVRTEFVWDPTEPVATRPLAMRAKNWGLNLFYSHDGNKNVSEVFYHAPQNGIAAHYDYAPFGAVTRTSSATRVTNRDLISENPFRFSSEYHDDPLSLTYYNYRHYNPLDGRWLGRDCLQDSVVGWNPYAFVRNQWECTFDILGLWTSGTHVDLTQENAATELRRRMPQQIKENKAIKKRIQDLAEIIVDANVGTDSFFGSYYWNNHYHFNRGLSEKVQDAKLAYIRLLLSEISLYMAVLEQAKSGNCAQRKEKCEEALIILGRLSHMLQDYYAHGLPTENNPTQQGVLGILTNSLMKPSSYGSFIFNGGEHGNLWTLLQFKSMEPGMRAPDREARLSNSSRITQSCFAVLLSEWSLVCSCMYEKEPSLWERIWSFFQ